MMKRRRTSKPSRHIAEINERTEASKSEARVCVGQPRAPLSQVRGEGRRSAGSKID